MKNTRAEIAQRLQGARDAAGLSIEETACALKLESDRYAAFESGASDLPMGLLPELARLFGTEAFVTELPKTISGKIRRGEIREGDRDHAQRTTQKDP